MNEVKLFTAFSGYDSQMMAFRRLEKKHPDFKCDLVGWSEIDKYAIKAHNLCFPEYADRNYGDICKIDWEKVPDFDVFTYSSPCFTEGTLVMTDKGLKPIESLDVTDHVLTHANRFRKVAKRMDSIYHGAICYINAMCFDEIICTAGHPFYVRKMHRANHIKRTFSAPEWVTASELDKSCYLGYAINTESRLPEWDGEVDLRYKDGYKVNRISALIGKEEFWYVMGRYIGDGWCRRNDGSYACIIACSDRNKKSLLYALAKLPFASNVQKENSEYKVYLYGKELVAFVTRFGYYASGKRIDGETMSLPVNLLGALVQGYMDSDGCVVESSSLTRTNKISTASRELAYGIQQCIAKVYKVPVKINLQKMPSKTIIEGREVNQKNRYFVVWKETASKCDKAFYEDGYVWFPLYGIESEIKTTVVYNLEVEEDHTYTANGAIVHNCQDFSNAGLQSGGDEGSGTRSSLLWECEKAIRIKRPKVCLLENVKALVSKKFYPTFIKWVQRVNDYGYTSYWQVMNAKDYGVPQNRERVFLLSVREDIDRGGTRFRNRFLLLSFLRTSLRRMWMKSTT